MPKEKTPYPDWAAPYTAIWEGDQWIAVFLDEASARKALDEIRGYDLDLTFPRLDVAEYGEFWYVGEVHP